MVQALPTGQIGVCDNFEYTPPTSTIGCIYIIGVNYNKDIEQKTKRPFFPKLIKANFEQFTLLL